MPVCSRGGDGGARAQAQKAFEAAAERLKKEAEDLDELLKQKEHHQACVLGIEASVAASPAAGVAGAGDAAAVSPGAAEASPKEGVASAVRSAGQTIHKGFWKLFSRKGEEGGEEGGVAAAGEDAASAAAAPEAPGTDVLKAASDTGVKESGAVKEGGEA